MKEMEDNSVSSLVYIFTFLKWEVWGTRLVCPCVNGSITHVSVSHSQVSSMFCWLVFSTVVVHTEVEDW